jgi:hypothetical protein
MIVDTFGSRTCQMDKISGRERYGIPVAYPPCFLGKFEEISPEQAVVLREVLRNPGTTKPQ